jgi:Arc/MetJ-type ribon-helix-helix transcriptional regulator
MTIQVPVRLTDSDVAALDAAIRRGAFANRSEALRAGLAQILREERERELVELYRKAYAEQPEEEWIGEVGLAALSALHEAEDDEPL